MSPLGPVALVVNPVAMRTTSRLRAEALRALAPHGLEWTLVTRGPGDAGRLAAQAAAEGARVVVTVGGDGTVAEAAGALAGGPVALAAPAGRQRQRLRPGDRLAQRPAPGPRRRGARARRRDRCGTSGSGACARAGATGCS